MIWKCVDEDQFKEETEALAQKFANAPQHADLLKRNSLIRTAFTRAIDDQLDLERDKMRELGRSDDYREGVDAFHEQEKTNIQRPINGLLKFYSPHD